MKIKFIHLTLMVLYLLCQQQLNALPYLYDVNDNELEGESAGNNDDDIIDLSHLDRSVFGLPDNSTGERLAKYNPETDAMNPEELGNYLEGDILMPQQLGRNGLAASTSRWPNGIIPFEIKGSFNAFQMNLLEQAMNEYHSKTCIKFVPRSNQNDYITIVNGQSGCWSSVGRIGGAQEVNFQTPGCMSKVGTVIHELMHACGFLHEQNRYERDDYVRVRFENIRQGTENNFDKASAASTNAFGVEYDLGSVMHYSGNAFSRNGRPTIEPLYPGPVMGQRNGFSAKDIDKLNRMYDCYTAPSNGQQYPYYPIGYGGGGAGPYDYYG